MKLKDGFVTREVDGDQIMLAVGDGEFSGFVRSNKTAAFIIDCLKTDTSKEQIIQAMCSKYDVPEEIAERDVEVILEKLRKINALDR